MSINKLHEFCAGKKVRKKPIPLNPPSPRGTALRSSVLLLKRRWPTQSVGGFENLNYEKTIPLKFLLILQSQRSFGRSWQNQSPSPRGTHFEALSSFSKGGGRRSQSEDLKI